MDFESTASTAPESSPSAGADTSVTASAGSVDVPSTESASVAQPEATASAATSTPELDAGWSLDDESAEPDLSVPETDDDLDPLTQEPGLDQAKVPGLVNAIKETRAAFKQQNAELRQLREQTARMQQQFAAYGGLEGANAALEAFGKLQMAPQSEEGTLPFLTQLYQQAYPAYERLVQDVIESNPDFAVQYLQEKGALPAASAANSYAQPLDADTLATIPEHLREIAQALPPHVQEDLLQQPDEVRNYNLERELKLSRLDEAQRAQAQQQWRSQLDAATQQGRQEVQNLYSQYEQKNLEILSKWTPFGPEDQNNQRLYKDVQEGAMAELLSNPEYAKMYQDVQALLENAPLRRLQNDRLAADTDERNARAMAARFNTRLGQLMRERVKAYDSLFSDALKWRAQQQNQPPRTEIGGPASQASAGRGVPTLTPDGKLSNSYIESLAQQYR